MTPPGARLDAKLALARGVGRLSRLRGGGATSAPGRVLMRMAPDAIQTLARRLPQGCALISATNGKTTTAAMAAGILERTGVALVHNRAGANMAGGIATTLLGAAHPGGRIDGQLGLFEVDEMWLAPLAGQLHPRAIVLGNLFRDQLDRYGELEAIAERWHGLAGGGDAGSGGGAVGAAGADARPALVLNADDPLVADLAQARGDADGRGDVDARGHDGTRRVDGRGHDRTRRVDGGRDDGTRGVDGRGVLFFGVEDDSLALAGMSHAADAKHCRRCGAPYVFDVVYLGHLGHYRCPSCGNARPMPQVLAREVELEGVRAASFTLVTPAGQERVRLALPGLYNVYNALAAAALATVLEVPLRAIADGLAGTAPVFGRAEAVRLGPSGRELRIMLVKNPAGANEVLRTLALEPGEHDLLGVLNDQIADGRDVSWIWDADFELLAGRVARVTCSGSRASDLAVRFKYAGVPEERIVLEPDLSRALERSGAAPDADGTRSGETRAGSRGTGSGEASSDGPGSAVTGAQPGGASPLYALPTYTAMLALRELLVARGEARSAWS